MAGKYIVLEPKLDPTVFPVLQGNVQINTGTGTTTAGELYPQSATTHYDDFPTLQSTLNKSDPLWDARDDMQTQMAAIDNAAAQNAAADMPDGLVHIPDGCLMHIQIWGVSFGFNANAPYNCVVPDEGNHKPALMWEYNSTEYPVLLSGMRTQDNPGANCYGASFPNQQVTNVPEGTIFKGFYDVTAWNKLQVVVLTVQDCPGQPGPYTPQMPVPAVPLKLPDNVPPPPPRPTPCPAILSGTVTSTGTNPGTMEFVAGANGYTMNLGVPCPCEAVPGPQGIPGIAGKDGKDGKDGSATVPTFAIGTVTNDSKKPISVKLRIISTSSYLFDFNIPGGVMEFVPLNINVPVYDHSVDKDMPVQAELWVPSDGTNDMRGAIGLIIEQILELRYQVDPNTAATTTQTLGTD